MANLFDFDEPPIYAEDLVSEDTEELQMSDPEPPEPSTSISLPELLKQVRILDEQIALHREKIQQLNEYRDALCRVIDEWMREQGLNDFSDGTYRAVRKVRYSVVDTEILRKLAPDLVVEQVVYKPDMRAVRVAMESPLRDRIKDIVRVEEELSVASETRKTVKRELG